MAVNAFNFMFEIFFNVECFASFSPLNSTSTGDAVFRLHLPDLFPLPCLSYWLAKPATACFLKTHSERVPTCNNATYIPPFPPLAILCPCPARSRFDAAPEERLGTTNPSVEQRKRALEMPREALTGGQLGATNMHRL